MHVAAIIPGIERRAGAVQARWWGEGDAGAEGEAVLDGGNGWRGRGRGGNRAWEGLVESGCKRRRFAGRGGARARGELFRFLGALHAPTPKVSPRALVPLEPVPPEDGRELLCFGRDGADERGKVEYQVVITSSQKLTLDRVVRIEPADSAEDVEPSA